MHLTDLCKRLSHRLSDYIQVTQKHLPGEFWSEMILPRAGSWTRQALEVPSSFSMILWFQQGEGIP